MQLTEPLTRGLMEAAHTGQSAATWQQPNDLLVQPAYVMTVHSPNGGDIEPSPVTDIYPSWYNGLTKVD
jgi:hypothetical protein